ncbi:putative transposase [Trichonephila clavipes]|nr:putative transposase [Trichonephila clavipes]
MTEWPKCNWVRLLQSDFCLEREGPQASVSGPIFWNININDLLSKLNNLACCEMISFADNILVCSQAPLFARLSPCDFFLFPKLKNHLKGHHFGALENIQTVVTDQLKAILISEFHQCNEEWKKLIQRCVASEGSYFEGDNVELKRDEPEPQQEIEKDERESQKSSNNFQTCKLQIGKSLKKYKNNEQFLNPSSDFSDREKTRFPQDTLTESTEMRPCSKNIPGHSKKPRSKNERSLSLKYSQMDARRERNTHIDTSHPSLLSECSQMELYTQGMKEQSK